MLDSNPDERNQTKTRMGSKFDFPIVDVWANPVGDVGVPLISPLSLYPVVIDATNARQEAC